MATAITWYLGAGSNQQALERLAGLRTALAARYTLPEVGRVLISPSIDGLGDDYSNQVLAVIAPPDPKALSALLKQIEAEQGRTPERMARGICDLDIDLLACRQGGIIEVLDRKALSVPALRRLLLELLPEAGTLL